MKPWFFIETPVTGGLVTFVAGTTYLAGFGSSFSQSYTHNPTLDGALTVKIGAEHAVTAISYGGVNLNSEVIRAFGDSGAEIWYGTEDDSLPTGSNTLSITIASVANGWIIRADTWDQVKQDVPFSASVGTIGNASNSNLAVTILENGMAIDICCVDLFSGSISDVGGQIEQFNDDDGFTSAAGGRFTNQNAGSKNFQWDWSGTDQRSHVAAALQPT